MNTEKVFTAFSKKGEEILLYRKDNDTYIDLNSDNNEAYNKDDIDLTTLTSASKSLSLRRHMLESSIKRKYKKDREKIVYTENILLGTEYIVKNLNVTILITVTIKLPKKFGLPHIPDAISKSLPYLNTNLNGVYI